jgi:hypothetical protein
MLLRELLESAPAAVTLLFAGADGLRAAGAGLADRAIAVAEIASSAWMLALLRREVRETLGSGHDTEAEHHAGAAAPPTLPTLEEELGQVDWAGVAGAAMLGVEALQHWRQTHHVQRPVVLLALTTLYLATGGRLTLARVIRRRIGSRRPRLALSPEGIEYRGSRRRRFTAPWDDVARVEHDAERLRITLRDGGVRELLARDHVQGHRLMAAVGHALPDYLPPRLSAP